MKLRMRAGAIWSIILLSTLSQAAFSQAQNDVPTLDAARIRAYAEDALRTWNIPGAAVGIVRNGQVVFLEAFGKRDLERNLPVTPRTRFILGSTTKAFTTMALGLLVDEGKLDWDKPVSSYLSEFQLQDEYASHHATVRDLACHRTGLPAHDLVWFHSPMNSDELVSKLRFLEPTRELRAAFQYSNLMYIALGSLIERVSGMPWDDFLHRRIFQPLGMSNSGCTIPEYTAAPEYAAPYRIQADRAVAQPLPDPSDTLMYGARASGSVNTTAEDMCKWMLLHLSGGRVGNKSFISPATLLQMHSPQIPMPWDPNQSETVFPSYGLGWIVGLYRSHRCLAHGGTAPSFSSNINLFPDIKTGVVVLINTEMPAWETMAGGITDIVLGLNPIDWKKRLQDQYKTSQFSQAKLPHVSGTTPAHKVEDYVGEYRHPAYGSLKVELAESRLQIIFHGLKSTLDHWNYETFSAHLDPWDIKLTFQTDSGGKVASISAPLEPSVKDIIFVRSMKK
jgi:CubicO group peptidase (beta-lactamase class C family)